MSLISEGKISPIKTTLIWGLTWALLSFLYLTSLRLDVFTQEWKYLIYFMQMMFDILIGWYSYKAYRSRSDNIDRKFYLILFASIIPGLLTNEIYSVLSNLMDIKRIGISGSLYWSFSYTLFLLIQLTAWLYLNINKANREGGVNSSRITNLPYVQSSLIIFLSLILILVINGFTIDSVSMFKIGNSFLEVCVFTLISFSLSRTKTKSLIVIEIGFLLLIGFNFSTDLAI